MKKFAYMSFVTGKEQIPMKFKILRRSPTKVMDWYVRKFVPFTIEGTVTADIPGFNVYLPLELNEASENHEKTMLITTRTLHCLEDLGVDIVVPPQAFPFTFPEIITISNPKILFPFFLMEAIIKALKLTGKSLKNSEILIIDGNRWLTRGVIIDIFPHINYLSVITDYEQLTSYSDLTHYAFSDCGLQIAVLTKNRHTLGAADVIINTSNLEDCYDYYFKKGAIYFDLSQNQRKLTNLMIKRPDLTVIDGIKIKTSKEAIPIDRLFPALYVNSTSLRRAINSEMTMESAKRVKEEFNAHGFTLGSFMRFKRTLH